MQKKLDLLIIGSHTFSSVYVFIRAPSIARFDIDKFAVVS